MNAPEFGNDRRVHEFTWKIENFSSCTQRRETSLKSPLFVAASLNRSSWYLSLYPRGTEWSEDIACFLTRYDDDKAESEMECKFRIDLIGTDDVVSESYEKIAKFRKGSSFGCYDFMKRNFLKENISCKSLTIKCSIKITKSKAVVKSENEAFTNIATDQCSFTWRSKVLDMLNSAEAIKSHPIISSCFALSARVIDDFVRIKIRRIKNFTESTTMICKITLLDLTGQKTQSSSDDHLFEACEPYSLDVWQFPDFLKKSYLLEEREKFLRAGEFTLKFKVTISRGATSNSIVEKNCHSAVSSPSNVKILTELQSNFKSLYNCKLFADVTLNCDGQTFPAHKCILISRSPVLRAMFCQDMIETRNNCVEISDLEAETLDSLLNFIYTSDVRFLDYKSAIKLLFAADKYAVLQLRDECAFFLEKNLDKDNVCEILISADGVEVEELKMAAIKYIRKNREAIFKSEVWELLVRECPTLATQTVLGVTNSVSSP